MYKNVLLFKGGCTPEIYIPVLYFLIFSHCDRVSLATRGKDFLVKWKWILLWFIATLGNSFLPQGEGFQQKQPSASLLCNSFSKNLVKFTRKHLQRTTTLTKIGSHYRYFFVICTTFFRIVSYRNFWTTASASIIRAGSHRWKMNYYLRYHNKQ